MVSGPYPEAPPAGYWPPTIPEPRLLTRRQERFCQAYAVMGCAAKAARAAGYADKSARQQAWRLLQTQRIRARLAKIHADIGRDFKDSLNVYIGKLELAYRQAIEDRRSLAAVRAVLGQAHLAVLRTKLPMPVDDYQALMQLNEAIRRSWAAQEEDDRLRQERERAEACAARSTALPPADPGRPGDDTPPRRDDSPADESLQAR